MIITRKGRFIYFDKISDSELEKLRELLIRTNKNGDRTVNMLFYDEKEDKYYTYFGYLKLIAEEIGNVLYKREKKELKFFDREKIANIGKYKLRDYQIKVVEACLQEKYGTVVASVGSGKSLMIMSLVNYVNKPSLIIVPTTQLAYQMKENFLVTEAFNFDDIGLLTGEEKDIRKFTIGTLMTVANYIKSYPDIMSQFKLVAYDECHTTQQSSTGRLIDEFYNDKADYIIGLTGTLYRYKNWKKSIEDFIMLGITGRPIAYIPIMMLVRMGYLTPPYVYFEKINGMSAPIKSWHRVRSNYIENYEYRNIKIANWIEKFYRNNLKSLTLVETKKHAQNIFELLPEDIKRETIIVFGNKQGMVYDWGQLRYTTIDYNNILYKLENGIDYKVCIATNIFSTGTDIPSLNALILTLGGKSMVSIFQKLGRVLRLSPTKKKVFIVDFYDNTHGYLKNHSIQRIKLYQREGIPIVKDKYKLEQMIREESKLQT